MSPTVRTCPAPLEVKFSVEPPTTVEPLSTVSPLVVAVRAVLEPLVICDVLFTVTPVPVTFRALLAVRLLLVTNCAAAAPAATVTALPLTLEAVSVTPMPDSTTFPSADRAVLVILNAPDPAATYSVDPAFVPGRPPAVLVSPVKVVVPPLMLMAPRPPLRVLAVRPTPRIPGPEAAPAVTEPEAEVRITLPPLAANDALSAIARFDAKPSAWIVTEEPLAVSEEPD